MSHLQSCIDTVYLNITMPNYAGLYEGDDAVIQYYPIAKKFFEHFGLKNEKFVQLLNGRMVSDEETGIFLRLKNISTKTGKRKRIESQFKGVFANQLTGFESFRDYLRYAEQEKISTNISCVEVANDFEKEIVFEAMKTALLKIQNIEQIGSGKMAMFPNHLGHQGWSYSNKTRNVKIYDKVIELELEQNARKKKLYFEKFPQLKNRELIHRIEIGYSKTNEIKLKKLLIGEKNLTPKEALLSKDITEEEFCRAFNQHFFANFKFKNRAVKSCIQEIIV